MWLDTRAHSIAVQPMSQVLEESPLKKQIARELGLSGSVQFLLRIGYVTTYPDPVSLRMPVSWFLKDLFWIRTNNRYYGALIISLRRNGLTFSGHVDIEPGDRIPIDRLWVVGDRLRLLQSFDLPAEALSTSFDRNVRAFGSAVQQTLADLSVGIVGCGGTGSAVAEQLVRLGVRTRR
jgi:hypothetical protein